MSLLGTMKQIAAQTGEAGIPAAIMFGQIETASPLKIRVDSRFQIWGDMIIVPRELQGLEAGEKVVLIRNQGGQQFLVVGRA